MKTNILYYLGDIDTSISMGEAREWPVLNSQAPLSVMMVKTPVGCFAFLNSCPHTGAPLNWLPNQFLSEDGQYIQCSTHFALFERETGACIAGPCHGQSLTAVTLREDAQGHWAELAH